MMNSVTVRTSLTRERYKLGTSMKEIEAGGECDLYRGLAMAQVRVRKLADRIASFEAQRKYKRRDANHRICGKPDKERRASFQVCVPNRVSFIGWLDCCRRTLFLWTFCLSARWPIITRSFKTSFRK